MDLDGVTLTLQRDRYVILEAAALPGLPLLLLGAISHAGWCHHERSFHPGTWIGLAADRDAVELAVRAAVAARAAREITRLVAALRMTSAAAVTETSDAG